MKQKVVFCIARCVVTVPVWWEAPCTGRLRRERNWVEEKNGFKCKKKKRGEKWVLLSLVCSPGQHKGSRLQQHEQLTLQKAQATPPGQTAGQTGNYPATQTNSFNISATSTLSDLSQCESHSLYRRSSVKCNPFLPSPWGLVSRCAEGCRDPPCCSNSEDKFSSRPTEERNVQRKLEEKKNTYVLILTCHS